MSIVSIFKAGAIGAAILATTGAAFAQQKKEITIGLSSNSFATTQLKLAEELGFFAKRGLSVKFVVVDGSTAALAALIAGSVNFANVGMPEITLAHAKGQKVVSVATIYTGFATSLVLSKEVADKLGVSPNAPIKERMKALDGRLIATPTATAGGTIVFKAAAEAAGANVRLSYIAQPAMQAALESKAIDGYMGSAPFWALPIVKGQAVLWISGPKNEFPADITPTITSVLLAMPDYARANPALVKDVTDALAEVSKAIQERPNDAKAAVGKIFPTLDGPTLDLLFAAELPAWITKQATVADMKREVGFIKALGLPIPDIDKVDPAAMVYP